MRMSRKLDMTRGHALALVVQFAIPLCLGNLLQQLYLTVDTMVVGRFCGSVSLAALATSAQPVELLLHLFMGLGGGVSILVSQYQGSGEQQRMRDMLNTAVFFLYLCSLFVTVLGLFAGPAVLRMMRVPDEVIPPGLSYLRIIFLGTLGSLGYNMNAGVLRGLGDSHSSLIFLIISCVTNVILDVLFVAVLHMDVGGAAIATVMAQYLSWVLSILYIHRRYPELKLPVWPAKMDSSLLREITRISIPLGINNSFYAVGHLLMQALINLQGAAFIAACSIGAKMLDLSNVACPAISMAITTYAGQNYGAKRFDRVKRGALLPLFSGLVSLCASMLMLLFSESLLRCFTTDPAVMEEVRFYLRIVPPFICIYTVFNGIIALANGIGDVRYPTVVNLLTLWAFRIPLGNLILHFFDGRYAIAAIPISFGFGLVSMLFFYRSHRWKEVCLRA